MDVLRTPDGLSLHLQRWPAPGTARGTVQIVHGLGEHIGRYADLALHLNTRGWNVVGHDHRGHGKSDGPRGGTPQAHTLLLDLSAALDHLRSKPPHVLLGHSLGGLLVARFAAESLSYEAHRWARDVDGIVLSSPALDPGLRKRQRLLLAVASRLAPTIRVHNGLNADWISRDAAVVQAYKADPLVHDRITPRLARFVADEGKAVLRAAKRWRTPTLLMWAGADRCVAPRGSAEFARAVPPGVLTATEYPQAFHEIFNEPEQDQVRGQLDMWLNALHERHAQAYTAAARPKVRAVSGATRPSGPSGPTGTGATGATR
jgi:alpha-beta hydrolase superfamily lysophospholipase